LETGTAGSKQKRLDKMAKKQNLNKNVDSIGQIAKILNDVLQNGKTSTDIPAAFADNPEFKELVDQLEAIHQRSQDQLVEIQAFQAMLYEQAIRDTLTGLYNRRYLEETLRRELARADRENYQVSVIMLDLDHFKDLNETYGYQAGDIVLQTLGKQLLFRTRFSDIPCRYGGEEFIIIMPNIPIETALKRAEELRSYFAETKITYEDKTIQATFSAGLSVYPRDEITADGLIRTADEAMRSAKSAGRNSIVSLG
jgi:diguanylate cyclase (GGDEF)-like protein